MRVILSGDKVLSKLMANHSLLASNKSLLKKYFSDETLDSFLGGEENITLTNIEEGKNKLDAVPDVEEDFIVITPTPPDDDIEEEDPDEGDDGNNGEVLPPIINEPDDDDNDDDGGNGDVIDSPINPPPIVDDPGDDEEGVIEPIEPPSEDEHPFRIIARDDRMLEDADDAGVHDVAAVDVDRVLEDFLYENAKPAGGWSYYEIPVTFRAYDPDFNPDTTESLWFSPNRVDYQMDYEIVGLDNFQINPGDIAAFSTAVYKDGFNPQNGADRKWENIDRTHMDMNFMMKDSLLEAINEQTDGEVIFRVKLYSKDNYGDSQVSQEFTLIFNGDQEDVSQELAGKGINIDADDISYEDIHADYGSNGNWPEQKSGSDIIVDIDEDSDGGIQDVEVGDDDVIADFPDVSDQPIQPIGPDQIIQNAINGIQDILGGVDSELAAEALGGAMDLLNSLQGNLSGISGNIDKVKTHLEAMINANLNKAFGEDNDAIEDFSLSDVFSFDDGGAINVSSNDVRIKQGNDDSNVVVSDNSSSDEYTVSADSDVDLYLNQLEDSDLI